ncbi:excalibur calcium-binding domain-containing protein [Novosphingobium colocasiae]|uniref:Excalibur calcium-binding domain-containing protein n=1 Tax=Novosphingobium colocasiae TaxID=1256513 RepID=A0A918UFA1_9SPHN|nr:excalibur calcium-binding domain-containing protein [Novosphingobium colocasiae]GGY99258.1 hypothetical protein GCM10011614_12710 [Novosphingobium colocasiae]
MAGKPHLHLVKKRNRITVSPGRPVGKHPSIARFILGAAIAGGIAGVASVALSEDNTAEMSNSMPSAAFAAGVTRANQPPPGAFYRNCEAARAAGVAPLYAGEPGYRGGMDADGDGIACEPYRGW